jgi:hypothetical protein
VAGVIGCPGRKSSPSGHQIRSWSLPLLLLFHCVLRDEHRKMCHVPGDYLSPSDLRCAVMSNGQLCTPDHQASRLASKHHLGMLCGTRVQGAFLNRHHVFGFWLVNEFSGRPVHSDMLKCIANNPICAQGWRIKSSCISQGEQNTVLRKKVIKKT